MSSMKYTNIGIKMDKPKHFNLFQELVPNNHKIITLEYLYQNNGQCYGKRTYWCEPIDGLNYKEFNPNNFKRFSELY